MLCSDTPALGPVPPAQVAAVLLSGSRCVPQRLPRRGAATAWASPPVKETVLEASNYNANIAKYHI